MLHTIPDDSAESISAKLEEAERQIQAGQVLPAQESMAALRQKFDAKDRESRYSQ